jgi:hypothetical protein
MRDAFATRLTEDDTFLHTYPDQNRFNQYFNHDFGCGEIRPAYTVAFGLLLAAWRQQLLATKEPAAGNVSRQMRCRWKKDGVAYKGITAEKIVFCDGIAGTGKPLV